MSVTSRLVTGKSAYGRSAALATAPAFTCTRSTVGAAGCTVSTARPTADTASSAASRATTAARATASRIQSRPPCSRARVRSLFHVVRSLGTRCADGAAVPRTKLNLMWSFPGKFKESYEHTARPRLPRSGPLGKEGYRAGRQHTAPVKGESRPKTRKHCSKLVPQNSVRQEAAAAHTAAAAPRQSTRITQRSAAGAAQVAGAHLHRRRVRCTWR